MSMKDTAKQANVVLVGIYSRMSSAAKGDLIFDAYRTGRELAIAGLKQRYPKADNRQLQRLWARNHLGDVLYRKVYGDISDE